MLESLEGKEGSHSRPPSVWQSVRQFVIWWLTCDTGAQHAMRGLLLLLLLTRHMCVCSTVRVHSASEKFLPPLLLLSALSLSFFLSFFLLCWTHRLDWLPLEIVPGEVTFQRDFLFCFYFIFLTRGDTQLVVGIIQSKSSFIRLQSVVQWHCYVMLCQPLKEWWPETSSNLQTTWSISKLHDNKTISDERVLAAAVQ